MRDFTKTMKKQIINIDGFEAEVTNVTAELFEYCKTFADTLIPIKYSTEIMVEYFNLIYMRDVRDYFCGKIITKSNLTHHSANTFLRTCQLLDLLCEFETENRHDGMMRDKEGRIILCAEWEMDEKTIFSESGEINKLLKTCKKNNCEAFLFTYNARIDPKELINKAYNQWNSQIDEGENFRLFLVTAIFDDSEKSSVKYLRGLRTFVIGKGTIDIWEDLL